jgi:hypothetical protein
MDINIVSEEILPDNTSRIILKIKAKELVYFGYIIESFEGWCNYTTIKKNEPFLQIDITPEYLGSVKELLQYLMSWN